MKKFKNAVAFTGPIPLRKAMVEELLKIGYTWDAIVKDDYDSYACTANVYNERAGLGNLQKLHSAVASCTFYELPQQWDECLKAASELEEEIPEYVKLLYDRYGFKKDDIAKVIKKT